MAITFLISLRRVYFQWADVSFFNRIRPDPGFVSPVQSDPGFVSPIRSDPVRSDPGFVKGLPLLNQTLFTLLEGRCAVMTSSNFFYRPF